MKKITAFAIFTSLLFIISIYSHSQNVAINNTSALPDASAMLDISSSDKGLLIPRMTTGTINSIIAPAGGLLVYNTTVKQLWVNAGIPAAPQWQAVNVSNSWALNGNAGTDSASQFIGTTDNMPLRFKINNQQAGLLSNSGNIFFGTGAGSLSTFSSGNIAIGSGALANNTTVSDLVAVGDSALYNNIAFVGACDAQYYCGDGYANTAVGKKALFNNTMGFGNTANGSHALLNNIIGVNNTANGYQAMYWNLYGYENTASGLQALYNTNGTNHTANGAFALYNDLEGSDNTGIGYRADVNSGLLYNATALGSFTIATAHNQVRIGSSYVTSIGGYAGWSNVSDGRFKKNVSENVPGLSFIQKLHPVTYTLDLHAIENFIWEGDKRNLISDLKGIQKSKKNREAGINAKEKIIYTGFIAQEVEKAAKESMFDFSGVDAPKNDKDLYSLRYAEFVVPLVKAVQEQQVMIEDQQKEIAELKLRNVKLEGQQQQINNLLKEIQLIKEKMK